LTGIGWPLFAVPVNANSDDINGVIKVIGYLLNFLGAPQPARGH
jgi:hypothetical protein